SRLTDWSGSVAQLALDFIDHDAAVEFLLERTHGRRAAEANDDDNAREIAAELDGLALALEQTGAFIAQMRWSLSEYLRRRRAREDKVRAWHRARLMHYPLSVAVTWDITFEQLDGSARALLNFLCWLAPEPVPRALLAPMKLQRTRQNAAPGETAVENVDVEETLASLAAFSMLK